MVWLFCTLLTAILTLALCWWPFNFRAKNDVSVDAGQGKAFFNMGMVAPQPDNRGHAFSRDALRLQGDRGASFHFLLTPLAIPKGLGCILTLHDGGQQPPLAIAQWLNHLALFTRDPGAKKGYREVGLKHCLTIGKPVALNIVTTASETQVLINGRPTASFKGFSLLPRKGQLAARMILGNNQFGTEPWHGSIQRVIIHDQATPGTATFLPTDKPVVDYTFSQARQELSAQQRANALFLVTPTHFVPLAGTFLAPIACVDFNRRSTWRDALFNVLGFLPIGCCFAGLSGKMAAHPGGRITLTVLAAFLFSLLIEYGQVALPSRHSSQLDLLCNTIGGLVAAVVALGSSLCGKGGRFSPHHKYR